MTKRLYIIVEGQTEQEFVFNLMAPYFHKHGVYVYPVLIRTSKGHKGGFVNYQHLVDAVDDTLVAVVEEVEEVPEPVKPKAATKKNPNEAYEAMLANLYLEHPSEGFVQSMRVKFTHYQDTGWVVDDND